MMKNIQTEFINKLMKVDFDFLDRFGLTIVETKILQALLKNGNMSRPAIYNTIWTSDFENSKTLDVHISRLRKKLTDYGLTIEFTRDKKYQLTTINLNRSLEASL